MPTLQLTANPKLVVTKHARWLIPIIAGALLPFGFAPFHWWPLILPGLWLLNHSLNYQNPRQAAVQGWLFGMAFFGVGVSWVFVSIHEHGNASVPLAGMLTALFIVGISLFPMLQFYLTAKLTPRKHPLLNGLSFLSFWVVFEWFRSWFLTGFPWLYLGNAFIDTPIAGWGPVTGVYGVTAVALFSVIALGWSLSLSGRAIMKVVLLAGIGGLWLGGWALQSVAWTNQGQIFSVAMVQADIAQADKWKQEKKLANTNHYLSLTDLLWDADLIIWPETALPYFKHQVEPLLQRLNTKAKQTETTLALGILSADFDPPADPRLYNSFLVLGQGEGLYHKQKLVPFGEYVPLESLLRGLIDFFNLPMSHMQRGHDHQSALSFRDKKLMPLICYEVVYPDFVASYATQADVLVTVSNDSWFGTSIGPHQHLQIAQMRALETQRYVLRATNNGITAIIDPAGKIEHIVPQFERTALTGDAHFRSGNTPFMVTGSWPVLLFVAALILFCGGRAKGWTSGTQ